MIIDVAYPRCLTYSSQSSYRQQKDSGHKCLFLIYNLQTLTQHQSAYNGGNNDNQLN